jgi:homoserine kinase
MNKNLIFVSAFAPATVANVAVGFDILGFALDTVGDTVTLKKINQAKTIEIESIKGIEGLPYDPQKNTATIGLLKMLNDFDLPFGFRVSIEKGVPLSSGMGGSAASSVAAVIAANAFLPQTLSQSELLSYALEGEKVASGAIHADNVAPALYGGLTLIRSLDPIEVINIHTPKLFCVVVHPDLKIETKHSRHLLETQITLKQFSNQSAHLAAFIAACFKEDLELLKRSCKDFIIEGQRAHLIKGFYDIKNAALEADAIACSISGSGPSLFALAKSHEQAEVIKKVMIEAFNKNGISKVDSWISSIAGPGARIVHKESQ